ncbi:MAG: HEAT repeat domain-containing protein, partial [Candidatus Hydrogenedentes bacterium]|nr:HEAT repeat domain-containing protein [Candidatus Hydrogenedentota bacterium]
RYALEPISGPAVDRALLDAMGKADGTILIGIVNSLGARRSKAAVGPLTALVEDGGAAREAAVAALGKIGGPRAALALRRAVADASPESLVACADAYLLCADAFLAEGGRAKAARIYREMFKDSYPPRTRTAALQGVVASKGAKAAPLVLDMVSGDDAALQAVAAGLIRDMPGAKATKCFTAGLDGQAPAVQVLIIHALAGRGDRAAVPALVRAADAGDLEVRAAALSALGVLGDESNVPLLAEAAACGREGVQSAAQASLASLRGDDVNATIVAFLATADAAVRVQLVRALASRSATDALPALLGAARDRDGAVRAEALKALAELAGGEQVPALVQLVVSARTDDERAAAERALVAASRRIGDEGKRAAGVLAALPNTADATAKAALFRVLGAIGDNAALDALRAGVAAGDSAVKDAAIRALAEWPDAAPLNDVLALAQGASEEIHRILALRGFIRMLGLPSERSGAQTLELYQQAMALASRDDEKKMVLAGLSDVGDKAVLGVIEQYLDNAALRAEVEQALSKVRARSYTGSASQNSGDAGRALDGNADTRWDTGATMKGGEWYVLDLGWDDAKVGRLVLDCAKSPTDYARGYEVYVSNNTDNWGEPVASGKGTAPHVEIAFTPVTGRYVKILQTGKSDGKYWSIHQLSVAPE